MYRNGEKCFSSVKHARMGSPNITFRDHKIEMVILSFFMAQLGNALDSSHTRTGREEGDCPSSNKKSICVTPFADGIVFGSNYSRPNY